MLFDETDGIDFEAVADTQPDVILASYSGLTQEEYDTLSKIAPVVAYPEVAWGTSVQDMIRLNSQALGLADEGEQLVADLDDADRRRRSRRTRSWRARRVMFAYIDPNDLSQIGFYTTHDTRPGFLTERRHGDARSSSRRPRPRPSEFYVDRSAPRRPTSFADVDVFVTYGDPTRRSSSRSRPTRCCRKIPAVERGAIADPRGLHAAGRVGQPVAAVDRLGHRRLLRAARGGRRQGE